MRVLLTGSAGFIGGHVRASLLDDGHEVVDFDLRHGDDVRDSGAVAMALSGVDAVVHQAAKVGLGVDVQDMPEYASVNAYGTAVLLAAMARHGVGRLVLASSMVVYGEGAYDCARHGRVRPPARKPADLARGLFEPRCPACGHPLTPALVGEDAPPDPRNAYATTKLAQEHLAANWARETAGTAVALRYHNVYGPGMPQNTPYAGVAAIFRSALAAGRPPRVFEDGRQRRDFIHVRDVATANALALEGGRAGELTPYNVATGDPHTIGDLAEALSKAAGGPEPVVTGDYRLGDVRHITASPARAGAELGFRAAIRFPDGLNLPVAGGSRTGSPGGH
jgi:dTDP-L-rhamnose 4-epimerase